MAPGVPPTLTFARAAPGVPPTLTFARAVRRWAGLVVFFLITCGLVTWVGCPTDSSEARARTTHPRHCCAPCRPELASTAACPLSPPLSAVDLVAPFVAKAAHRRPRGALKFVSRMCSVQGSAEADAGLRCSRTYVPQRHTCALQPRPAHPQLAAVACTDLVAAWLPQQPALTSPRCPRRARCFRPVHGCTHAASVSCCSCS